MGIMVYSLLWVMQDVYHQPYTVWSLELGFGVSGLGVGLVGSGFRQPGVELRVGCWGLLVDGFFVGFRLWGSAQTHLDVEWRTGPSRECCANIFEMVDCPVL